MLFETDDYCGVISEDIQTIIAGQTLTLQRSDNKPRPLLITSIISVNGTTHFKGVMDNNEWRGIFDPQKRSVFLERTLPSARPEEPHGYGWGV